MSFISSRDGPNPDDPNDPLNYAPRSVRGEANLRSNSTPQTRPIRLTSSRSDFDEMLKDAVAKSMRHPLELEVVYDDQPRARFSVAGRFAAAFGVLVLGFLFFLVVPPTSAGTAKVPSEDSQALLQKFVQFRTSQGSNNPEHALSEFRNLTPAGTAKVESQALLEKFIQWKQRQ
jgi:hypothetical protein